MATKNRILTKLVDAGRKKVKVASRTKRRSTPINRVVLVLDESSSMNVIRDAAANSFNEQVESIKAAARKARQRVEIQTIRFADTVKKPEIDFNVSRYNPYGWTALWDAINVAIHCGNLERRRGDTVLIVVITDGDENRSKIRFDEIRQIISEEMVDENFSIVANVPHGTESRLIEIGVPAANIRTWEATNAGVRDLALRSSRGYTGLFTARAGGQSMRASTVSYMANMDAVTPNDLEKMIDVSQDFKRFRVEQSNDGEEIADFIRSKGLTYVVGNAFYELTKSEKVSHKKRLLVLDRQTGALYAGDQARRKLGLPIGDDIRLKPGTHGDFTLFVESTSYNRHLVGGTTLLYRT